MNRRFERARDGDPSATIDVVRALHPRLARMAAFYARRCGEDTDDLLQEAWVGLLEALPNLDPRIGNPAGYLIQRARWRLLDAVKRERVRRCSRIDGETADRTDNPSGEYGPASACVLDFIGRLSATQRDVLKCLLDGLTWREAAMALNCTSANIAYHVRRIRRQYEEWSAGGLANAESGSTRFVEARSIQRLGEEVGK